MRQPYRVLTIGFLVCAAMATAGALVLLNISHTVDVSAEVGKWLLTVAAALVLTGALSMVAKQIDQRRAEREAWHAVLHDLVAANQTVLLARGRLAAHRSARTYRDQLAELMRARVELRRILAISIVAGDLSLLNPIKAMRIYLDALGQEYESGYLLVARQQRLDEVWLTDQMKAAMDGAGMPQLPAPLAEPTQAWRLLEDPARFPRLAALLDDEAFPLDTFRTSYKRAKTYLETKAGYAARPITVLVGSGRKLAGRADKFVTRYDELPDEVKKNIAQEISHLGCACDNEDRLAIDDATVKLTQATSRAISALYPPAPSDTAVQQPTAAAESAELQSRQRYHLAAPKGTARTGET